MGIIVTRNKRAEKISDLTGNPKKHLKVHNQDIIYIFLKYFLNEL